jgi:hypothetical protein
LHFQTPVHAPPGARYHDPVTARGTTIMRRGTTGTARKQPACLSFFLFPCPGPASSTVSSRTAFSLSTPHAACCRQQPEHTTISEQSTGIDRRSPIHQPCRNTAPSLSDEASERRRHRAAEDTHSQGGLQIKEPFNGTPMLLGSCIHHHPQRTTPSAISVSHIRHMSNITKQD